MLHPRFRETAAHQALGLLLPGGTGPVPVATLSSLLYALDRKALIRHGRPVSHERYHLAAGRKPLGVFTTALVARGIWTRWKATETDHLSEAQEELVRELVRELESSSLDDMVAGYPELGRLAVGDEIRAEHILCAAGWPETDIRDVRDELDGSALADRFLGVGQR